MARWMAEHMIQATRNFGEVKRTERKKKKRREKEPVQDSFRPVETDAVAMTWQLGETKWDEKFWGQETNDA